jgi:hypothetical protein
MKDQYRTNLVIHELTSSSSISQPYCFNTGVLSTDIDSANPTNLLRCYQLTFSRGLDCSLLPCILGKTRLSQCALNVKDGSTLRTMQVCPVFVHTS